MLGGLNIHVFIITEEWKLGPKRDIHGKGGFKGPIYIFVRHDRHGRGE
jgi:hypothetical protein